MTFLGLPFVGLFVVTALVYWLTARWKTARLLVLTVAGYLMYAGGSLWFAAVIFYISCLDYGLGRLLDHDQNQRRRRLWLAVSVISNLGLLGVYKYISFFGGFVEALGGPSLLPERAHLAVGFPVGLSFFLLQSLSHSIDVYRKKYPACKSLPEYLLFVSFFPRLLAGPVVRADQFLPQLQTGPSLSAERRGLALFLLISGVIKKLVFADYMALNLVDKVFDLPILFSTTEVILSAYAYTIQLYCEFSGYTDIALALALLLGLELPANFRFPLQAANIRQFWRRWFISLSTLVRDYVYLPLGGSKGKRAWLVYPNLIIVFLLVGLAVGPAWNFIIWGLLNGLALALTFAYQRLRGRDSSKPPASGWRRMIGIFFTFHFVVISWSIFRATDIQIIKDLWTILGEGIWGAPNLSVPVVVVLALGILGALFPVRAYEAVRRLFIRLPLAVQLAALVLVLLFVFKVSTEETIPFVYERF